MCPPTPPTSPVTGTGLEKGKRGHCACSHGPFSLFLPCHRMSQRQLCRKTLERFPPTMKSKGWKLFLSATWTPFSSPGLPNLEADTMRLCVSGIQAGVCQSSTWPLTGRAQTEAFHRPRSHPSPAHFVPQGCVCLGLFYACAAGAGREVGRPASSVCHRRRLCSAALAPPGMRSRR